MTQDRMPREADTRTTRERPKVWQPAATLPEPDRVPGYEYRWVRIASLGKDDPQNVSARLREGWEPVRIEEQPQFHLFVNPESRFRDNVEVGGLLLCKIPSEFIGQRAAYYARKTKEQMDSVDNNFMRENDARMPLFAEKRSKTSFGSGR